MNNTSLFSSYPKEDHLPVLHRLALAYLMLPVFIYLLGWFHYWFSVPATALLMAGLWRAMAGSWRVTIRPVTIALLLLALGWVMLTAAGGVFDLDNGDWKLHRTMLSDLARHAWPVYLSDPICPLPSARGWATRRPATLLSRVVHDTGPDWSLVWASGTQLGGADVDVVRCCLDCVAVHADVHDNAGGDRCRGNSRIF